MRYYFGKLSSFLFGVNHVDNRLWMTLVFLFVDFYILCAKQYISERTCPLSVLVTKIYSFCYSLFTVKKMVNVNFPNV